MACPALSVPAVRKRFNKLLERLGGLQMEPDEVRDRAKYIGRLTTQAQKDAYLDAHYFHDRDPMNALTHADAELRLLDRLRGAPTTAAAGVENLTQAPAETPAPMAQPMPPEPSKPSETAPAPVAKTEGASDYHSTVENQVLDTIRSTPESKFAPTRDTHPKPTQGRSRTTPQEPYPYKSGSVRIGSHYGPYGRDVEVLTNVDPKQLELSEEDWSTGRNEEGRGTDAHRYADWIKEGKNAPPVSVVITDKGKLRVVDGHRRVSAAKLAGVESIPAWVSPRLDTGKVTDAGKPIFTIGQYEGLTQGASAASEEWNRRQNELTKPPPAKAPAPLPAQQPVKKAEAGKVETPAPTVGPANAPVPKGPASLFSVGDTVRNGEDTGTVTKPSVTLQGVGYEKPTQGVEIARADGSTKRVPLTGTEKVAGASTGLGKRYEGFTGRGATLEQVYGKEAVAQGRAVPIFGPGEYVAQTQQNAQVYGETVTSKSLDIQTPYVIDTGEKWRSLLLDSGTAGISSAYGGHEFYEHPENIPALTKKLQAYLQAHGHDGVIVDVDAAERTPYGKRVVESFSHNQAVKFAEETPTAAQGKVEIPTKPATPPHTQTTAEYMAANRAVEPTRATGQLPGSALFQGPSAPTQPPAGTEGLTTVRDASTLSDALQKHMQLPKEEADAVGTIADARANVWAEATGKPPDEWFGRLQIGTGEAGQGALYQSGQPWYYSKAERVVSEKMPNRMVSGDARNMLLKNGVKPEEMKWSGLDEYLTKHPFVTKGEVLQHLAENNVQVEEVTKGEDAFWMARLDYRDGLIAVGGKVYDPSRLPPNDADRLRDLAGVADDGNLTAQEQIEWQRVSDAAYVRERMGLPKFGTYTTPGGENYRELLLTLPDMSMTPLQSFQKQMARKYGEGQGMNYGRFTPDEQAEYTRLANAPGAGKGGSQYRSSHWDEPNVLAHVRFDDRTGPNGERVLHVAEIQSDWHQAGRKQGYRGDMLPGFGVRQTSGGWWEVYNENAPGLTWSGDTREAALRQAGAAAGGEVPPAPFAKTWHELAAKKILHWAASHGDSPDLVRVSKPVSIGEEAKNVLGRELSAVVPYEAGDGGVLSMLKRDQVRKAVIANIPVDVVNILRANGIVPEGLLKSNAMLTNIPQPLRRRIGLAFSSAMRDTAALLRAELARGLKAGSDVELLPALKASDLDAREVVGMLAPELIYHDGTATGTVGKLTASRGTVEPNVSSTTVGQKGLPASGTEFLNSKISAREGAMSHVGPRGTHAEGSSATLANLLDWHNGIIAQSGVLPQGRYEHGYDRVTWDPGSVQADRYDLSKQVDGVHWQPSTGELYVTEKGAPEVSGRPIARDVTERNIADYVGKEVAHRLLEQPESEYGYKELTGSNLKVGGAGMVGFYDRILPETFNKLGKQYGARVGETEMPRFAEGQDEATGAPTRGDLYDVRGNRLAQTVPSIPITDALRRAATSVGFPLFQGEKASTEFLSDNRAVIRALQNPDVSSAIHELAHVFRRDLEEQAATHAPSKNDLTVAAGWAGATGPDGWTREAEEKFARGFESYMRDGKAPSPGLKGVFDRFRDWMTAIYQKIAGSPLAVKLSDEMRGVFDDMLSKSARQRQAGMAYNPFGRTGPSARRSFADRPLVSIRGINAEKANLPEGVRTGMDRLRNTFLEHTSYLHRVSPDTAEQVVEHAGHGIIAGVVTRDSVVPAFEGMDRDAQSRFRLNVLTARVLRLRDGIRDRIANSTEPDEAQALDKHLKSLDWWVELPKHRARLQEDCNRLKKDPQSNPDALAAIEWRAGHPVALDDEAATDAAVQRYFAGPGKVPADFLKRKGGAQDEMERYFAATGKRVPPEARGKHVELFLPATRIPETTGAVGSELGGGQSPFITKVPGAAEFTGLGSSYDLDPVRSYGTRLEGLVKTSAQRRIIKTMLDNGTAVDPMQEYGKTEDGRAVKRDIAQPSLIMVQESPGEWKTVKELPKMDVAGELPTWKYASDAITRTQPGSKVMGSDGVMMVKKTRAETPAMVANVRDLFNMTADEKDELDIPKRIVLPRLANMEITHGVTPPTPGVGTWFDKIVGRGARGFIVGSVTGLGEATAHGGSLAGRLAAIAQGLGGPMALLPPEMRAPIMTRGLFPKGYGDRTLPGESLTITEAAQRMAAKAGVAREFVTIQSGNPSSWLGGRILYGERGAFNNAIAWTYELGKRAGLPESQTMEMMRMLNTHNRALTSTVQKASQTVGAGIFYQTGIRNRQMAITFGLTAVPLSYLARKLLRELMGGTDEDMASQHIPIGRDDDGLRVYFDTSILDRPQAYADRIVAPLGKLISGKIGVGAALAEMVAESVNTVTEPVATGPLPGGVSVMGAHAVGHMVPQRASETRAGRAVLSQFGGEEKPWMIPWFMPTAPPTLSRAAHMMPLARGFGESELAERGTEPRGLWYSVANVILPYLGLPQLRTAKQPGSRAGRGGEPKPPAEPHDPREPVYAR